MRSTARTITQPILLLVSVVLSDPPMSALTSLSPSREAGHLPINHLWRESKAKMAGPSNLFTGKR